MLTTGPGILPRIVIEGFSRCVALVAVLAWAVPVAAQLPSSELGSSAQARAAPTAEPRPAQPTPFAAGAPREAATPTRASSEHGPTALNDGLLIGVSALSIGLAPASIALFNPDLRFGTAVQVSLVGTLGVLCASGGMALMIAGGGLLALSPILALLGEDVSLLTVALGALGLGVGIGLFLVAPLVFSVTAEVDGRFGDSAGHIAVVSTVSMLAAGATTFVGMLLLNSLEADSWAKVLAVTAMAFLAANVAYGITRAAMLDDPAPAMAMLTPPVPF